MRPWKRIVIVLWLVSLVASVFVPLIFCAAATLLTLVFACVVLLDLNRREVERLAMRSDHVCIVRHGFFGRTTELVPWSAVDQVELASESRGWRRDAVILGWKDGESDHEVLIGTGRPEADLRWMKQAFELITTRARA